MATDRLFIVPKAANLVIGDIAPNQRGFSFSGRENVSSDEVYVNAVEGKSSSDPQQEDN